MGGENSKAQGTSKDEKQPQTKLHTNSAEQAQDALAQKRVNTSHGSDENRRHSLDSKALLSQFRGRLKTNQESKPDTIESMKQFNPMVG